MSTHKAENLLQNEDHSWMQVKLQLVTEVQQLDTGGQMAI